MIQRKKNIILIFTAFLMISFYIWEDQKIKSRFENRKQEYLSLNQELTMGNSDIGDIQDLRKQFMENQEKLNLKKISGDELLQEVERLKSLANSMDMSLAKLTIDPRNTFPTTKDLFKNNQINIARHSLNFELRGNFLDVGVFVETIEKKSNQLKLQYCSIGLDSLDPQGVIAKIEYLTYGGLD